MLVLAWLFWISIIVMVLLIGFIAFITYREKFYIKVLTSLIVSVNISSWSAIVCGLLWLGGKFF